MALRPDRSSSYNTVFATPDGLVVDVEGSATDAELEWAGERGTLAHTNHYACARMAGYEGDPAYARRSAVRLARARELLDGAAPGTIDGAWMRRALSDHATTPSICRHAEQDSQVATAFWCVVDVTRRRHPLRAGQRRAPATRSGSPSPDARGGGRAAPSPTPFRATPARATGPTIGAERAIDQPQPVDAQQGQRRPHGERERAPAVDHAQSDGHDAEPGVGQPQREPGREEQRAVVTGADLPGLADRPDDEHGVQGMGGQARDGRRPGQRRPGRHCRRWTPATTAIAPIPYSDEAQVERVGRPRQGHGQEGERAGSRHPGCPAAQGVGRSRSSWPRYSV